MTIQDLEDLRESRLVIRLLKKEIEDLESLIVSVNPHYSDTPKSSPKHDKMGNCIVQLIEFKEKLSNEIQYFLNAYAIVHEQINVLEDTNYRLVLSYRYILDYKFGKIAYEMNYNIRTIFRMHERALSEFELL